MKFPAERQAQRIVNLWLTTICFRFHANTSIEGKNSYRCLECGKFSPGAC